MLRIRLLVENNLDGNALHDLDVVACRILRWQQTEARARSSLNAVHVSFENFIGIGINPDLNRLSRFQLTKLTLFEVGRDPDLSRHDRHQRLPDLHEHSFFNRLARYTTRFGRVTHPLS